MQQVPKKLILIVLALSATVVLSGCVGARTDPPANVGTTSATLKGTINYDVGDYGQYWFEYSAAGSTTWIATDIYGFFGQYNPNVACNSSPSGPSSLAVSKDISGLSPGARYVYRIAGHVCQYSFSTPPPQKYTADSSGSSGGTNYSTFISTPTITSSSPASPANDTNPEIKGNAASGMTVKLYTTSNCSGTPVVTGTGATFGTTGLTVPVADNSTTAIRATASDAIGTSACSAPFSYAESSPVPAVPIFASPPTNPASPADNNSPKLKGSAEAGSTVKIYTNSDCSGSPLAVGSAGVFANPGFVVTVPDNSSLSFRATATNENGSSQCSAAVSYVENTPPPNDGNYPDPTWWDDKSQLEKQTIMDFIYMMGPQGVTPYPGEPATRAAEMYAALPMGFSSNSGERDLTRQGMEMLIAVGLIPTPRPPTIGVKDIPRVGGTGTAGTIVTGLATGLLVGDQTARFFNIGYYGVETDHGPGDFCYTAECSPHLIWYDHGETIYYGAKVEQSPGAYLYSATLNGERYTPVRWFQDPCTFSGYSTPPAASLATASSGVSCFIGHDPVLPIPLYAPVTVETPYREWADGLQEFPRPYVPERDGQPDIQLPAPPDPGIGTAEERAEDELEGDKALLRAWIDWNQDPERKPDEEPTKEFPPGYDNGYDRNRRCNPSGQGVPRYVPVRKPGYTGSDTRAAIAHAFSAKDPTSSSFRTANLYWGSKTFGLRHIAYKHGWGAGDISHTATALGTQPTQSETGNWRYQFTYPGPGGGLCRRIVIVDYVPGDPSFDPGAKHIITSYHEGI